MVPSLPGCNLLSNELSSYCWDMSAPLDSILRFSEGNPIDMQFGSQDVVAAEHSSGREYEKLVS